MRALAWSLAVGLFACTSATADAADKKEKKTFYVVEASMTPSALKNGTQANWHITITPEGEWVLKTETPFKVTVTASENLQLSKNKFSAKDFKDPKAKAKQIETAVTVQGPGDAFVQADLVFFLCNPQICERHTETIRSAFVVQ